MEITDKNGLRCNHPEFLADYEIGVSDEELEKISLFLNSEEEAALQELNKLENASKHKGDFLKDMLESAKEGAIKYLDSWTDVSDTMNEAKDPSKVNKWKDSELKKTSKPSNTSRTVHDASSSPFDNDVEKVDTSKMSDAGVRKFEQYREAYSQRIKSEKNFSLDGNHIDKNTQNLDTLSGLRSYRFGPVVAVPTVKQAKDGYDQYVSEMNAEGRGSQIKGPTNWLYDKNMDDYYHELANELGFSSANQAKEWARSHNMTVHETVDGMFLVPTDVHDSARHDGFRSRMSYVMKGKDNNGNVYTEKDYDDFIRQERVALVKHEASVRAERAVRGAGMAVGTAVVRTLLKDGIAISIKEFWAEFKVKKEDSFVSRIKNTFHRIWEHMKLKFKDTLHNFWESIKKNVVGAIITELFNALNDFVFKTAKNIFKIMRTMWGSIVSAFKIMFSSKYSWQERIFEASKIVSAGFVGVIGFSLNDIIQKLLMSIGFPFASFIADILSGLFASIMSSLVLVIFDSIKDKFMSKSDSVQKANLQTRLMLIDSAKVALSSLKTTIMVEKTFLFTENAFRKIQEYDKLIKEQHLQTQVALAGINDATTIKNQNIDRLNNILTEYRDEED